MIAFVRDVSQRLQESDVSRLQGGRIDVKRARRQHAKLVDALKTMGADVESLRPSPEEPEGVFVESVAVPLPDAAVLARPASARRPEVETAATALGRHRPVVRIAEPAALDGRDVLRIGRTLYVGLSQHTNADAVQMLAEAVEPFGYDTRGVEVNGCAHLKTACTFLPPHFVLINPAWVDPNAFRGLKIVEVDSDEPYAANTLSLGVKTLVSSAYPKTEKRLMARGIATCAVEIDEFHKAGAGISNLVLLLEPRPVRSADVPNLQVIESTALRNDDGVFAPAVVHGGIVYVSGQLPIDPKTGKPIAGGIEEQTEKALSNLASVLVASGSATSRLLRLTFFVSEAKHHESVARVCARMLDGHRPAGTIVAAKSLFPGCAVSIDAIAAAVNEPSAILR